jgi:hypothetical protein
MAGNRQQRGDPVNNLPLRWSLTTCLIGLITLLASGCVAPVGGYGHRNDVGGGYYEPYGSSYGAWENRYRVAPFHDGGARFFDGEHSRQKSYRPPPPSRVIPSIPRNLRSRGDARPNAGDHSRPNHLRSPPTTRANPSIPGNSRPRGQGKRGQR